MSTYYARSIPAALHRVHPALGVRRLDAGDPTFLDPAGLPVEFRKLPEAVQDQIWEDWTAELLETVASRGQSRILVDLSDRLGLEELLSFPECARGPRPGSLICEVSSQVARVLAVANPADLVQTVNSNVYLTVVESWDTVFLHVNDPVILHRFCAPALLRRHPDDTR